jgi:hypothetical protein
MCLLATANWNLENSDGRLRYTFIRTTRSMAAALVLKYGQINPSTGIPASYDTYPSLLDGIAEDWHLDDANAPHINPG